MIQEMKTQREEDKKQKEQDKMKKDQLKDKRLKEELHKRRVEIGVASNIKRIKQDITAIIQKEAPPKKVKFTNPID